MAIKLITVKCPECGSKLYIEDNQSKVLCNYCGSEVLIHNENEYVVRHIHTDEAEVKRAEADMKRAEANLKQAEAGIKKTETDYIIQMRQMELNEKSRAHSRIAKVLKYLISMILGVIGILMALYGGIGVALSYFNKSAFMVIALIGIMMAIGSFCLLKSSNGKEDNQMYSENMLKVPDAVNNYSSNNYEAVRVMFEGAGFTNVTCVPLMDLTFGIFAKPGKVESITINGDKITSRRKKYPKDSAVVISYHSMNQ